MVESRTLSQVGIDAPGRIALGRGADRRRQRPAGAAERHQAEALAGEAGRAAVGGDVARHHPGARVEGLQRRHRHRLDLRHRHVDVGGAKPAVELDRPRPGPGTRPGPRGRAREQVLQLGPGRPVAGDPQHEARLEVGEGADRPVQALVGVDAPGAEHDASSRRARTAWRRRCARRRRRWARPRSSRPAAGK